MSVVICILYIPIHILKSLPKSNEEEKRSRYLKYTEKAENYRRLKKYDSAKICYDSSMIYSNDSASYLSNISELNYESGKIDKAIILVDHLIKLSERTNSINQFEYITRSQYYFANHNYENAISDLKIAIRIDTLDIINIETQISMLYLLLNKNDSALSHIFNAEKKAVKLKNLYTDEQLKELNLLKCIYYIRKNDSQSACQYFKLYNENEGIKIYSDLYLDEKWVDNWEKEYLNLFEKDFKKLIKWCN